MPTYTAVVTETRQVEVMYSIEAENADDAAEKAERGETIGETELRTVAVINRTLDEGPTLDAEQDPAEDDLDAADAEAGLNETGPEA